MLVDCAVTPTAADLNRDLCLVDMHGHDVLLSRTVCTCVRCRIRMDVLLRGHRADHHQHRR